MKKILIISRNYPPLRGGMERLNLHVVEELATRAEVHLIAPEGAVKYAPQGVSVTHVPLQPLSRFLLSAAQQTLRLSSKLRPDVCFAGSGLTAPFAYLGARRVGAKATAYVHGLDLTVPHPIYRALWRPALRHLDTVITNSRATSEIAQGIGIPEQKISIIHPGVSIPPKDESARQRFRQTHQLGDRPVLLSVGRLAARKGLREFVSEALPSIVKEIPDVLLVIVGTPPSNALYAEAQTPESILESARNSKVEKHIRFLGNITDAELLDAYAGSDLHVFPVRHFPNDPEGFGMVAVEAAASGLPTVAYATGGVIDAVDDGVSGMLIPPGDANRFSQSTCFLLRNPLPSGGILDFSRKFVWSCFGDKLGEMLLSDS